MTELAAHEMSPVPAVTIANVAGSKAPGARPYPDAAVMHTWKRKKGQGENYYVENREINYLDMLHIVFMSI